MAQREMGTSPLSTNVNEMQILNKNGDIDSEIDMSLSALKQPRGLNQSQQYIPDPVPNLMIPSNIHQEQDKE